MHIKLSAICAQLRYLGYRRLLVLSGEEQWVSQCIGDIKAKIQGDWLTLSSLIEGGIPEKKAHLLLGREFLHAIFDARRGFHSEALAMLAGTLKAGSLLVLCTPPQKNWAVKPDDDSLRWNEQHGMIPTPNFVHHLQHIFKLNHDTLIWEQGLKPKLSLLAEKQPWTKPSGKATFAQKQALTQLLSTKAGVWSLIAPRGRGKSTLAGMLIQRWQGECWCCAPAKVSTEMIEKQVGHSLNFWSPDELLRFCERGETIKADWLIIDEAATIPTYILKKIIMYFPRVLLTTTVDGYEGTGRGFLNKFCAEIQNLKKIELHEPMRWAIHDPLESWLNQALLLQEPDAIHENQTQWQITPITQQQLASNLHELTAFYGLLTSAHYRTSPLDLRRLLDARGQHFLIAKASLQLIGAVWMVEEGGLDKNLSWQVWAGNRRPRGNLVAQSLAAHSYFPNAAQMKSQRVMRIAVEPSYRRQSVGRNLVVVQKQSALTNGIDYLSVSFGFTPDLLNFWINQGFHIIRIGHHLEASSGSYAAMAMLPLSIQAHDLCERAKKLFARDLFWRKDINTFNLTVDNDQTLQLEDWHELIGFGFYNRSLAASSASIQRLLIQEKGELRLLKGYFQQQLSIEESCQKMGLTGQKQWLNYARAEIRNVVERDCPELVLKIEKQINVSYL